MRITTNKHRVASGQWEKWRRVGAHAVFNDLFEVMLHNQRLFVHPKAPPVAKAHWHTTAWNAAWVAADYAVERCRSERRAA